MSPRLLSVLKHGNMIHKLINHVIYVGFAELQSHYSVLVRNMPDDYMNTVSQLESHLTGDHIGSILECKDAVTANQRILDCLIAQLDNKEDTFDLCNWLSIITDAPLLTAAIEDLKIGTYVSIYLRPSYFGVRLIL